MTTDLQDYYARRAREYEKVYDKPERQANLATLRQLLMQTLSGHNVLELACGTGYWTQPISLTANSILATDVNQEVLDIARAKLYPRNNVHFMLADAYSPSTIPGNFTALFAGFWWSHIPKSRLPTFLMDLHSRLGPGTLLIFVDNNYVEGSNHPITRQDEEGNTYQLRKLEDGREYEVLKNFPTESELLSSLGGIAEKITFNGLKYYWTLTYLIKSRYKT